MEVSLSDRDTSSVGTNCHSYKNCQEIHSSCFLQRALLREPSLDGSDNKQKIISARNVGHNTSRYGLRQKWSSWAATKTCSQANLWVPRTLFYGERSSSTALQTSSVTFFHSSYHRTFTRTLLLTNVRLIKTDSIALRRKIGLHEDATKLKAIVIALHNSRTLWKL